MFDTAIKGGCIAYGIAGSARTADVGIKDGIITGICTIASPAGRLIQANGALMTPGWSQA